MDMDTIAMEKNETASQTSVFQIIWDVIRKIFTPTESIFYVDRHRYIKLLDENEIDELSHALEVSHLNYLGINTDKKMLRQDRGNICRDFRKAKDIYKRDSSGEGR